MVLNGSLKLWISKKLQYNEEVAVVVNIARSIVFFKLGSGKGAGAHPANSWQEAY